MVIQEGVYREALAILVKYIRDTCKTAGGDLLNSIEKEDYPVVEGKFLTASNISTAAGTILNHFNLFVDPIYDDALVWDKPTIEVMSPYGTKVRLTPLSDWDKVGEEK